MRHETHTHLKRPEVFEAAKKYFGEGGLGMKQGAEQGTQLHFYGDGLVWLTVWPAKSQDNGHRVDIDVSERDNEARDFIEKVLKATPPKDSTPNSPPQ